MYSEEQPSRRPAGRSGATGRAPSGGGYSTGCPASGYHTARPSYSSTAARRPSPRSEQAGAAQQAARGESLSRRPVKSRRFRRRNNAKPIVAALAAILVIGLGVFGTIKLIPMLGGGVPISEAVTIDETVSLPPQDTEDVAANGAGSVFDAKVAACYSEDAFVVEHLQVPSGLSTHPMLATVSGDSASAYSTEPVAVGSSGQENIDYWKTVNNDTIGWLKIPGTKINYAVVQGPSTAYYTELGYDKKYSKNGVIWAAGDCAFGDGKSSSLSFNTVLYGHNWTNYSGTPRVLGPNDEMFAQLTGYHYQWFTQSHPYIWFSTGSEEMLWQVFAVFYADTGFRYINPTGGQDMLNGILARSEFNIDVPVSTNDKILTLSTCTQRFGPSRQQRFVVCAKLVDGVSDEPATVTVNPNPVRPKL